jgi:hypothetical protein
VANIAADACRAMSNSEAGPSNQPARLSSQDTMPMEQFPTPPDGPPDDPGDDPGGDDNPPDDDGPPDDDSQGPLRTPDPQEERLICVLESLRHPPPAPPKQKAKLQEPNSFDGSNAKKLHAFLMQCNLNFRSCPDTFSDNEQKVNYALLYLKGTALDWFEPYIDDPDSVETWMFDWSDFVRQLKSNFGPMDPTGDAEMELTQLRMKDGQRITKFNVEFNRLTAICKWGDAPLCHVYYSALPPRIKDALIHFSKPTSLTELREKAQTVNARYWECRTEQSREQSAQKPAKSDTSDKSSGNKSEGKSSANTTSGNNNAIKTSGSSAKGSGSSAAKPSDSSSSGNNSASKPSTSLLADKLGKDGKLTKEER